MITVRDLIELLKKLSPDRVVVLQKDSEGNAWSPLDVSWRGAYAPHSDWSGDVYLERLTDEDRSQGFDESDLPDDDLEVFPAVILVPAK